MAAPQKIGSPASNRNSAVTLIGNFIQFFDEIYITPVQS
ncbi:hypothetical protein CHCC14821_0283 [Bacillus paralicheniformis]|nr:hypothetical protein CHCC14821_0283 [Bacillus paralicheniformis]